MSKIGTVDPMMVVADNLYDAALAWYEGERKQCISVLGYVPPAEPNSYAFNLGTALQAYKDAKGNGR